MIVTFRYAAEEVEGCNSDEELVALAASSLKRPKAGFIYGEVLRDNDPRSIEVRIGVGHTRVFVAA